jgi:hypothetical protein
MCDPVYTLGAANVAYSAAGRMPTVPNLIVLTPERTNLQPPLFQTRREVDGRSSKVTNWCGWCVPWYYRQLDQ